MITREQIQELSQQLTEPTDDVFSKLLEKPQELSKSKEDLRIEKLEKQIERLSILLADSNREMVSRTDYLRDILSNRNQFRDEIRHEPQVSCPICGGFDPMCPNERPRRMLW